MAFRNRKFDHEKYYRRDVMKNYTRIGKIVQSIISFHVKPDGSIDDVNQLQADLEKYSAQLATWANEFWSKLLQRQANRLAKDFKSFGLTLDPYGPKMRDAIRMMLNEQVTLIKTLPIEAGTKAQQMAFEATTAQGDRFKTLIDKLQGLQPSYPEYSARRLARTEVAKTQSLTVQYQAQELGITQYVWQTCKDEAVRESHQAMQGKICSFDDPPFVSEQEGAHAPGQIWNCFTGDTLVSIPDDLIRVIRAPFKGSIVNIRCSDSFITATLNHPILTQRGWIPAGKIRKGDYLLKPFGNAVKIGESNEDDRVTTFDQLFSTVRGNVEIRRRSAFNFYGDIPNGDVDCATVDRSLLVDLKANVSKPLRNFSFTGATGIMLRILDNLKSMGFSGICRKPSSIFKRGFLHSQNHGFRSIPDRNVIFYQPFGDCGSVNAKGFSKAQNTFAPLITADDLGIIKMFPIGWGEPIGIFLSVNANGPQFDSELVRGKIKMGSNIFEEPALFYEGFCVQDISISNNFSGHVYTLETQKGWYQVGHNQIITKNCRCWAQPLLTNLISNDK